MSAAAILALADGTVFRGRACGAPATTAVGEVVFNTAMTGYQEILSDPSYAGQLVTLTYPHIGNYGICDADLESDGIKCRGLIIRDLSCTVSNWRAQQDLNAFLSRAGTPGIAGIDTRMLTRRLRTGGAQNGCLTTDGTVTAEEAVTRARACPSMQGQDLAATVTAARPYTWTEGAWVPGSGYVTPEHFPFRVTAYDFGVKRNILRLLAARGCRVTVVPARTPAEEVLATDPDGIFLSNGPGDPQACTYAQDAARAFLSRGVPLFGICLGHQLLALASGGRTVKMKFGHHGANHPVRELATGRVYITSQNHGFAVDEATLPDCLSVTHRSLFDGTLQGIARRDTPAFGFQGHPEASPGPHDPGPLFDHFVALMRRYRSRT